MKKIRKICFSMPMLLVVSVSLTIIAGNIKCTKSDKSKQLPVKSEEKADIESCSDGKIEMSDNDSMLLSEELWSKITATPYVMIGEESSKVIIVDFTDFECAFCAKYANEIRPEILSKYVQTGKVKYIIRDGPLSHHKMAYWGHMAARCAGDQDMYFEMNDMLFFNQQYWTADNPAKRISEFAEYLKINVADFDKCVNEHMHIDETNADLQLATLVSSEMGGMALPLIIINRKITFGVKSMEHYENLIKKAME